MKKIFLFLLISLISTSLVLAANGNTEVGQQGANSEVQTNTELQTQNKGEATQLQNQVRVQSGNYENSNGAQMQIQNENQFRLKVGGVEAKSNMQIGSEYDSAQNKTMLKTQLSNGMNAEIKVMPNTASQKAIERLQLKVCNSENNCSIELKEVGKGEQSRAAYEVQAQKEARVLGLFKTKMQVQAQIDAETGEIIKSKKPWWAFLAAE
jgi:hypothetical protein